MKRIDFVSSLVGTSLVTPRLRIAIPSPAPRFAFHNNFWVNLHHRLYQTADWADARKREYRIFEPGTTLLATPERLPANQRQTWQHAVEVYRQAYIVTNRDLLFDAGLDAANARLSDTPEHESPQGIPATMGAALESTAAAYRAHLWPTDRTVNATWIAEVEPRAAAFGNEMQRRLSHVYDARWLAKSYRIDVARYAYRFGCYTDVDPAFVHTVMESGDRRLQGLAAVEMLYHEASHSIVFPDEGTIGAEIGAAARRSGHPEPEQFWHAVIFYSAGAVAEETFRAHGRAYRMYADVNGLFGPNTWPTYRRPLQTHWQTYMDRGGDFRVAIDRCVSDLIGRA